MNGPFSRIILLLNMVEICRPILRHRREVFEIEELERSFALSGEFLHARKKGYHFGIEAKSETQRQSFLEKSRILQNILTYKNTVPEMLGELRVVKEHQPRYAKEIS